MTLISVHCFDCTDFSDIVIPLKHTNAQNYWIAQILSETNSNYNWLWFLLSNNSTSPVKIYFAISFFSFAPFSTFLSSFDAIFPVACDVKYFSVWIQITVEHNFQWHKYLVKPATIITDYDLFSFKESNLPCSNLFCDFALFILSLFHFYEQFWRNFSCCLWHKIVFCLDSDLSRTQFLT